MDAQKRTIQCVSQKKLQVMMGDASAASIWRWTKAGILPPPRQIGPNRKAWFLHELEPVLAAFPIAECKKVAPGCTNRGRKSRSKQHQEGGQAIPTTSQFKTTNQEMAAHIESKTGRISELSGDNPGDLVSIKFHSTPDVVQAAMEFASGCPESRSIGGDVVKIKRLYTQILSDALVSLINDLPPLIDAGKNIEEIYSAVLDLVCVVASFDQKEAKL